MIDVYTVESGSYSDYRVHGVFSTEVNAQAFIDAVGMSGAWIEERDLDPFVSDIRCGAELWQVEMSPTGKVLSCGTARSIYDGETYRAIHGRLGSSLSPLRVVCETWATSEEHAIKITNDYRTQQRAEGKI